MIGKVLYRGLIPHRFKIARVPQTSDYQPEHDGSSLSSNLNNTRTVDWQLRCLYNIHTCLDSWTMVAIETPVVIFTVALLSQDWTRPRQPQGSASRHFRLNILISYR